MCLFARESESVLVARVGLPRGRSDAASSYLSPDDATGQPDCHSHELPRLFVSKEAEQGVRPLLRFG
jgi:hypothetical protein